MGWLRDLTMETIITDNAYIITNVYTLHTFGLNRMSITLLWLYTTKNYLSVFNLPIFFFFFFFFFFFRIFRSRHYFEQSGTIIINDRTKELNKISNNNILIILLQLQLVKQTYFSSHRCQKHYLRLHLHLQQELIFRVINVKFGLTKTQRG